MPDRPGKKEETLLALWEWVKRNAPDTLEFSNNQTKEISQLAAFSNQFDVTHIDTTSKLPDLFKPEAENVFLVNLGFRPGRHKFVRGTKFAFCPLPPPSERADPGFGQYVPGFLDDVDDSEAGALSLAFNKEVFADFIYHDRHRRDLEIHLPRRTKVSFEYGIGPTRLTVENLQVEVDFLVQGRDVVGLAEAKVVSDFERMPDFNVLQLYLPYRRLVELRKHSSTRFEVHPVFVLGRRKAGGGSTTLRLYEFAFETQDNAYPIHLKRSKEYEMAATPRVS